MESLTPGYQGSLRSRIQQAAPLIFNFDFPLAEGISRLSLETKILAHYYTREIGCETVGLWQFWLENKINEIMPYYNQLYDTLNRDFDYLQNVNLWDNMDEASDKNENNQYGEQETVKFTGEEAIDITTDLNAKQVSDSTVYTEGNTTGNSTTDVTTTSTDNSINSDYPQANLSDTDYATSAVNSTSQGTSKDNTESTTDSTQTQTSSATVDNTSNQTSNQTRDTDNNTNRNRNTKNDLIGKYSAHHVRHTAGLNGNKTYVELMQEYREALINIDMMIINELGDLFMLIY